MEQLTRERAVVIFKSGEWKEWSLEYIAKLQLYQDRLCVPFGKFHEAITQELGREVWTHEFADIERLRAEYEGKRKKPTLVEIMEQIPEVKRLFVIT